MSLEARLTKESDRKMDNFPRPIVVFDKSLLDAPYSVDFNSFLARELFREFGMPADFVSKLMIVIKRNGSAYGTYYHGGTPFGPIRENPDKIITLHVDGVWKEYQKNFETARRITQGEEKPEDQFDDFLHTRKLTAYLAVTPSERGLKFADKLLQNVMKRKLNFTFLHKAKHALDDSEYELWRRPLLEEALAFGGPLLVFNLGWYVLQEYLNWGMPNNVYFPLWIGGNMATYYLTGAVLNKLNITLNPVQRSANEFAKQLENHPRWRYIVTITPK